MNLDEKWSWKPHIKDLLQKLGHRLSVNKEFEVSTHKYADEENAKKTKDMWICFGKSNPQPPTLYIGGNMIKRVDTFKLLGVGCQSKMK